MLTLITEDCWTEPGIDGWERHAKRLPCTYCGRKTRGRYVIEDWCEARCAQCILRVSGREPLRVLQPNEVA